MIILRRFNIAILIIGLTMSFGGYIVFEYAMSMVSFRNSKLKNIIIDFGLAIGVSLMVLSTVFIAYGVFHLIEFLYQSWML